MAADAIYGTIPLVCRQARAHWPELSSTALSLWSEHMFGLGGHFRGHQDTLVFWWSEVETCRRSEPLYFDVLKPFMVVAVRACESVEWFDVVAGQ